MIKKTLIVALTLFIAYSAFLIFIAPAWWRSSQYQLQENMIKAQSYKYDKNKTFKNVIVGSSLSCRLIMDSLPDTYNLSFGGLGIYDGLDIIINEAQLPQNIFIEENALLTKGNKDFSADLNSPVMTPLRGLFHALRADKQPLGIIGEQVNVVTRAFLWAYRHFISRPTAVIKHTNKMGVFSKMLQLQIKTFSKTPNEELVNNSLKNLDLYITKLKEKGVNFVFFEMPIDSQLTNLPTPKTIREAFLKHYPATSYQYIPIPDSVYFETTDGVHLVRSEAIKYSDYINSKFNH